MAAHDATIASIEAPTQQLLDVSYKQYQITTDAARRTGASNQDIDRITADYQKKWVAIKGKTELQVATATQAKAAARQELRLTQALQMGKAQNYLEMAQEGLIDDATARSRLFRLAGYDVPATSLRPQQGRQQDPFKTLQDNIKLIGQYDMQLKNKYRYDQKTGRLRVVKPQYLWQNPDANKPNEKHDTVPATWRDRGEFTRVQIFRERLAADNHQISAQRVGGRVVDIASAAGPLAHGITREKPRTQRQQPAPAELQRRGTREAYDLGIQLGYWQ
ncbi:MAG: hypothetical protein GQ565_02945 [Candidatus Aegiribacteria sp.]|nr:hypothetical protein [Candidatus Aegiribacteria sp.]